MNSQKNAREDWPPLVRVGLWGLGSRGSAWVFFWGCIVIGAICSIYGFSDRRFFQGSGLLLAALWYYLAIRWVDRNGRWNG